MPGERFPIGGQSWGSQTNHRRGDRSPLALASAHLTQFDLQISADNAPGPVLDGGKLNNFLLCYYQGCYISQLVWFSCIMPAPGCLAVVFTIIN